jgi:hypothetical protein
MCLASPTSHSVYLIRQLKDMQTGARKDKNVAAMKPIVDKMSDAETRRRLRVSGVEKPVVFGTSRVTREA